MSIVQYTLQLIIFVCLFNKTLCKKRDTTNHKPALFNSIECQPNKTSESFELENVFTPKNILVKNQKYKNSRQNRNKLCLSAKTCKDLICDLDFLYLSNLRKLNEVVCLRSQFLNENMRRSISDFSNSVICNANREVAQLNSNLQQLLKSTNEILSDSVLKIVNVTNSALAKGITNLILLTNKSITDYVTGLAALNPIAITAIVQDLVGPTGLLQTLLGFTLLLEKDISNLFAQLTPSEISAIEQVFATSNLKTGEEVAAEVKLFNERLLYGFNYDVETLLCNLCALFNGIAGDILHTINCLFKEYSNEVNCLVNRALSNKAHGFSVSNHQSNLTTKIAKTNHALAKDKKLNNLPSLAKDKEDILYGVKASEILFNPYYPQRKKI